MVDIHPVGGDPEGLKRCPLRGKILLIGRAAGVADEGAGHVVRKASPE